jgi:hypothetical protein
VARKLLNVCVVFTLVLGCWGGVLAAAVCPHMGCKTTAAAPEATAHHGEHAAGHEAVSQEDHSGHAAAHDGHAALPPAHDEQHLDGGRAPGVTADRHDPACAHCVGTAEAPPSRSFEWQSNSFKQGGKLTAPPAAARVSAPAAVFLREITPAQHAPPGSSDRHLLLNVFRI